MRYVLTILAMCLFSTSGLAQTKEKVASTDYLLSSWLGLGTSQTHTLVLFEGDLAYERCEAALKALQKYNYRFNSEYTTCIPFTIESK